ncbi:aldose epimerase family protein [Teichococcus aerofrigidensis]
MLALRGGGWEAEILPDRGAAFASLAHEGRAVLRPLDGGDPNRDRAGAFWMLPWTNRLDGGCLRWRGVVHRFPLTHPREGNALHGLGRAAPWQVEAAAPERAVLAQRLVHPPFDYAARLEIALGAAGLDLRLTLRHLGAAPCPAGFGWHPWFLRPEGCRLRFAATHRLLRGPRKLPVGAVPCPGLEGDAEAWLGQDDHYAGWSGAAVLRRPDLTLSLVASGDWAGNLQLFAPPETPVLCLEPVSHLPDVVNRPALAPLGAMRVLAPGEALSGRLVLAVAG